VSALCIVAAYNTVTCPGDVICSSLHVLLCVMQLCVPFGQYTRQHGYGYMYRYLADMDTSLHHFLKQSDTWICLNIFFQKIIQCIRDIK
jgi:hypothetical protein